MWHLLSQLPQDSTIKILTDAGAVAILALAVLFFVYVLLQNNQTNAKTLNTMLEYNGRLAVAVEKMESHENDQTVVLKDVVSSNEKVVASNDKLLSEIGLTRKSSDDHQNAIIETIAAFSQDAEKSRSSMVGRLDNLTTAINKMVTDSTGHFERLQAIEHLLEALQSDVRKAMADCNKTALPSQEAQP